MQRFSEQQYTMLKHFREKAELEYYFLLRQFYCERGEGKIFHKISNKFVFDYRLVRNVHDTINLVSTDSFANGAKVPTNLETPPATPESIPMSIGNSPILKHSSDMAPKYPIISKAKNVSFCCCYIVKIDSQNIQIHHVFNYYQLTSRPSLMHAAAGAAVGAMEVTGDSEFLFEMDGLSNEKYYALSDVDESDSDGK